MNIDDLLLEIESVLLDISYISELFPPSVNVDELLSTVADMYRWLEEKKITIRATSFVHIRRANIYVVIV